MSLSDPFGLEGQRVDGLYHVERAIGEGGSSVVYRGMHMGLGEPIALKCLKLATKLDSISIETFTRRFRDEGRLLYRLGQGNLDIVRCIASGTTVSTTTGALVPYTVLEWLEGCSVSQDFRARRKKGMTGRTLDEVIAMFQPAALALDYAHRQGVVHRDVKPGNLYLQKRPGGVRIKVVDFGLAKILDETIGIARMATAGRFMMYSPRYAAPEQFNPKVGVVGPWTDVFALALVLLEALRDRPVRKSDGPVACMAEALDTRTDLSASALGLSLPASIEGALLRAVSHDPAKRFASAGDLWSEIRRGAGLNDLPPVSLRALEGPPSSGDTIIDAPMAARMGGTLAMEASPNRHPLSAPPISVAPYSPQGSSGSPQGAPANPWPPSSSGPPLAYGRPPSPRPPAAYGQQSSASPPAWYGPPPWSSYGIAPVSPQAPQGPAPGPASAPAPRWGAAQVARPHFSPSSSSGARVVLIVLVLVAMVFAAGGFLGWRAWQARLGNQGSSTSP